MANAGMMVMAFGSVFLLDRMLYTDSAIEGWQSIRILMFYGAFIVSAALRMPMAILYFVFYLTTGMLFPQAAEVGSFMRNHGYNLFFDVPQLALVLAWGYEGYLALKHDDDSYNKNIERKALRFGHTLKRIAIFSSVAAGLMILAEMFSPVFEYFYRVTEVIDSTDFATRKLTFDALDILAFTGGAVISTVFLSTYYYVIYTPAAFVARKIWNVLESIIDARFPELWEEFQDHEDDDSNDGGQSSSPVSQSNRMIRPLKHFDDKIYYPQLITTRAPRHGGPNDGASSSPVTEARQIVKEGSLAGFARSRRIANNEIQTVC
ncbi:MAG: hypothetical protein KAR32_07235, partial [Candidatus Omnitrophica bacterium]|nr:hypothetical protein [Candidatus Omnitrophota bacterium]